MSSGPAERRERPERRREPRVEDVRGCAPARASRTRAQASGSVSATVDVPVRALPQRQLMAPPDLAGDVPVRRVLERLRSRSGAATPGGSGRGRERSASSAGFSQLLHRAPPLQRDPRLDPALAAVAERDRVPVRLALLELAVLACSHCEDALVRLLLRQPGELAGLVVHPPVRSDHRQLRQAVVAADLVVRAGRDRASPSARRCRSRARRARRRSPARGARPQGTITSRPTRSPVAIVVRVHGHRDVGQDRRRPHRRDRDVARRRRRAGSARRSSASSTSTCATSRSESDVWWNGHQLMIRFAR